MVFGQGTTPVTRPSERLRRSQLLGSWGSESLGRTFLLRVTSLRFCYEASGQGGGFQKAQSCLSCRC